MQNNLINLSTDTNKITSNLMSKLKDSIGKRHKINDYIFPIKNYEKMNNYLNNNDNRNSRLTDVYNIKFFIFLVL